MAISLSAGYVWTDGEVVTATKLNLAAVPTVSGNGSYLFSDGSAGAPSISFNSETTLGFYRIGSGFVGLSGGLKAINATSDTQLQLGQDSSHNLNFLWTYNATAGSASAVLGTFSKNNDLTIQAKNLYFDSSSLAFAIQLFAAGRVRAGGGSDDTVNAFQVNGSMVADEYTANTGTLSYSATTTIDFSAATCQTVTLTGNVTFATSNLAAGRAKKLRVVASGGPWTISIPGWKNINNSVPASIASGKTAELNLFSWGTTDANVTASYGVN